MQIDSGSAFDLQSGDSRQNGIPCERDRFL